MKKIRITYKKDNTLAVSKQEYKKICESTGKFAKIQSIPFLYYRHRQYFENCVKFLMFDYEY